VTASEKLPEPDLSGQTLERYHLLHRIGVGGMGAVYEAEHTRLRKRFAVKLLRYELANNEVFRKRFLREARAASAVSHPHVVAISDFGETDDGHVFFVMELLAGRDLQELLESQRTLPWPRTREILLQVTAALQAAHMQDIIHRDIKPSNVFLADVPGKGDDDFVKVLDFGIAKLLGNMGEATAKLTSTDEIFGTVAYMAPEMVMGKNDDPRSDMYAVGVMMFRMLTGQLPYTEGNAFQILTQHIHAPIPSLREKNPSIPEPVEAIVLRAMAKQPADRLATMEAFNQALRYCMHGATEVLTGMQATLLAAVLRAPTGSQSREPDVDNTTPLPAPPPRTEVVSPLPRPSPFAATESGSLVHHTVGTGDSGSLTPHTAPTVDSSSPTSGLTESAAIPRFEQTVASTPIVIDQSGAIRPALPEPSAVPAEPIAFAPSAPITLDAPSEPTAPTPPELGVALDSESTGKPAEDTVVPPSASTHDQHETDDEPAEPRRSPLGWLLPVVGAAAVLGVVGFFLMGGPGDESDVSSPAEITANASSVDARSDLPTTPPTAFGPNESKADPPMDPEPDPVELEPADPSANDDAEQPADREPALEPDPLTTPEETKTATTKPKSDKPKSDKPKSDKPKPKTDKAVVEVLKSKITAKCKDQLGGKVKIEGMINSAGKVDNLLVTPPDGLGSCDKLVKAAKFDPQGGVRPMPRFSVEP